MTNLKLPGDDEKKRAGVSNGRLVIWIVVAGVGLYLVISGVVGIVGGGS